MRKTKRLFERIIAIILCAIMLDAVTYVSAFAAAADEKSPITNEQIAESLMAAQFVDPSEDSTFVLARSDVQISDIDYFPETADMQEAENYAASINSESTIAPMAAGPLVGDVQVCMVQKWLNQEYRSKTGAALLTENGRTSSYITNALTRALQYEMGMTSWSDAWGPNTGNLYLQNILSRQDGVTDNKFAILQAALWCKGYSPGYYFNYNEITGVVSVNAVFNENVENAIIRLKQDMGISNTDGTVTLNVMKALMSMDDFKRVSGGDEKVREMQQKLNRKYEPYFTNPAILPRLSPCDGIYSANTNRALIYAFQAEEGLPVGVANGSYGNTTRNCTPRIPYDGVAKSYSGSVYTSSQISAFTELLQFALYVNGFDPGNINGAYGTTTQQAIRDFQRAHAIPVTGKADLGTWLSLFISCGDRDRPAIAADCATILTAQKAQSLYNAGYRYVGRYLTGTYGGGTSKALTREEIQHIFNAGLRFWPIYQTTARENAYFTPAQGTEDAKKAITAASALGIPRGTIIYFAVDFDAMDYQITSNIIPYFQKVHEEMSKGIYKTGVYGARNVCSRVSVRGYAVSSFVGNISTGFSGNIGFSMPSNWAFNQFTDRDVAGNYIKVYSSDGAFEIDKNGFSGRDLGVGRIEPAIDFDVDDIGDIDFGVVGSDTVYGPEVNIMGSERRLFAFDVEFNLPKLGQIESHYDQKTKKLEVTIGYKFDEEIGEPANNEIYWQKQYGEIKQLVNALGGKTNQTTYNKFRKMRKNLKKMNMDFGFDFNTYYAGYLEIDFSSNKPKLISGGLGFVAEATTSIRHPVYYPIFVKFEIRGTLEAGLKFALKETGRIGMFGNLAFKLRPSLGPEVGVKWARAFTGISGELLCALESEAFTTSNISDSLKIYISASLFFEYEILKWGNRWDWKFTQAELYPGGLSQQAMSINPQDLNFLEPLPPTKSRSVVASDIFQENMQVYAKPQIVSLGNGNMFMTFIDDASDRTPENSSILMYSVFDGSEWSVPQSILDDGTADFEPSIYPDGNGGVHILWQNATNTFDESVILNEMATGVDLSYIHWEDSAFDNLTAITSNNQDYESSHKIVSSGDNISVVWEQNSENDPFSAMGTNSIFRKQFASAEWQSTETLASGLSLIANIDTAYIGSDNVVAYTAKSGNYASTTNDLEVYYVSNSQTTRLTDDDVFDYSVSFLNDELYWISDNSIVSIMNGDINSREIVLENLGVNLSEIKVIGNANGDKSIVWEYEDDSGMTFYATNYNSALGSFEGVEPLTTNNGVVRGWDACLQPNGQIELSYCYAGYLDEPVNGKPYGILALMQKPVNQFYDITVDPIVTYDGDILANEKITLFAAIYNKGSQSIEQFEVDVFDESNIVVQTLTVDQNLAVGESTELEIPFTLSPAITRTNYRIQILPVGGGDISLSDNEAVFSIGFADLAITDIHEMRNGFGRQLIVTVKNQGFDNVSEVSLNLFEESSDGAILNNKNIANLAPGTETELTFNIDESYLDASVSEDPRLFYLSIETESEESDYSNNSETVTVYPDYSVSLIAGTGGSVSGSGLYENNSSATITATPSAGYMFDAWYEDGKLLAELPQTCELAVNWNRTLEARFKPTDLAIFDIDISGILETGKTLTFTTQTDGGNFPYKWSFYVSRNGTPCYSKLNSDEDYFTYKPSTAGTYTVSAYVEDDTGYRMSYEKRFTMTTVITIRKNATVSLADQIPKDITVSKWASSEINIVDVNSNGVVTALKRGTSTVTATTNDGQVFYFTVKVDFTWWQMLLLFLGIGIFFLPWWI